MIDLELEAHKQNMLTRFVALAVAEQAALLAFGFDDVSDIVRNVLLDTVGNVPEVEFEEPLVAANDTHRPNMIAPLFGDDGD
jgi:hypothetical protein